MRMAVFILFVFTDIRKNVRLYAGFCGHMREYPREYPFDIKSIVAAGKWAINRLSVDRLRHTFLLTLSHV
jgi:hypothetical protein